MGEIRNIGEAILDMEIRAAKPASASLNEDFTRSENRLRHLRNLEGFADR